MHANCHFCIQILKLEAATKQEQDRKRAEEKAAEAKFLADKMLQDREEELIESLVFS